MTCNGLDDRFAALRPPHLSSSHLDHGDGRTTTNSFACLPISAHLLSSLLKEVTPSSISWLVVDKRQFTAKQNATKNYATASLHNNNNNNTMSATQEVGEIFGSGSGPAHAMLRSPTVLIASVGLWGMNIYFFRLFGINYTKVLKFDLLQLEAKESEQQPDSNKKPDNNKKPASSNETMLKSSPNTEKTVDGAASDDEDLGYYDEDDTDAEISNAAITWSRLVCFTMSLLFLLHATYFIWIDVLGGNQLGAVLAFYGVVTLAILFPLPSTRWLRKATVIVLQRCFELVNPRCSCVIQDALRAVPFVDVFFADALCSLSKVFFDWGMLFHMLSHYPHPVPPSPYNILIPTACAAVPFLIRARQCLVMWSFCKFQPKQSHDYSKRLTHLANALKYATSIFPLSLSAYQKTIDPKRAARLDHFLILLLVINTLYALYWYVYVRRERRI